MRINSRTIETIAKYVENCGVKRLTEDGFKSAMQIKPNLLKSVKPNEFKLIPLEKDIIKIERNTIKPFSKKDLKQIKIELQSFMDNIASKKLNFVKKPKFSFLNQDFVYPFSNHIFLDQGNLLNTDVNKVVLLGTKTKMVHPKTQTVLSGSKEYLEGIIEQYNIKNVKIAPMTQNERIMELKSSLLHEATHIESIGNMMIHPEIGLKTFINEFSADQNSFLKFIWKYQGKKTWQPLLKKAEKLDINSDLAKQTKQEFIDYIKTAQAKDKETILANYYNSSFEQKAYQNEREFYNLT